MMSRLMRAVRVAQFGGPEVLKVLSDVPVPTPQDGQVLIKVQAAGVNPVDTYIRAGTRPNPPALPYTPGMDAAGVVDQVGPGVKLFQPGDRVYTVRTLSGSYAEYTMADINHTFKLHAAVTFQQGAGLGVAYFTAYRALFTRGQAKSGETVLVHGASGGVGIAVCQLALAYGMRVLGTAGSTEGLNLLRKNGVSEVFNHSEPDYCDKIKAATSEAGVDVIVEMLSNVNLEKDLDLLGQRGRVMVVGSRGRIEIDPRATMGKESDIRGVMLLASSNEEFLSMGDAVYAGLEAGWLRPVIGEMFTLDQAAKAHSEILRPARGMQVPVCHHSCSTPLHRM